MDKKIEFSLTGDDFSPIEEKTGNYHKDSMTIRIAGIGYYLDAASPDLGLFCGYLEKQPDNEYDPNAIGIYKKNGELIGYVPRVKIDAVNAFTKGKRAHCIISVAPFLDRNGDVRLSGEATILKFFEGDIGYMQEMVDALTVCIGRKATERINRINKMLENVSLNNKESVENGETEKPVFNITGYYAFPEEYKAGVYEKDTMEVTVYDAGDYFDMEEWDCGVFAGFVRMTMTGRGIGLGVFKSNGVLVGSIDVSELSKVRIFCNRKRQYCLIKRTPSTSAEDNIFEVGMKIVIIRHFADDVDYCCKLYDEALTRLMEESVKDVVKFNKVIDRHRERGTSLLVMNSPSKSKIRALKRWEGKPAYYPFLAFILPVPITLFYAVFAFCGMIEASSIFVFCIILALVSAVTDLYVHGGSEKSTKSVSSLNMASAMTYIAGCYILNRLIRKDD